MLKLTVRQLMALNEKATGTPLSLTQEAQAAMEAELQEIAALPYRQDPQLFYIHKSLPEQAVLLGCLIATRCPFPQGNGQTALLAMLTLLELNGIRLRPYRELPLLRCALEQNNAAQALHWIRNQQKNTELAMNK